MDILRKTLLILLVFIPSLLLADEAVNINTADKETLMTAIKGVGEKRAEAIITYREQHGPFESVDELAEVGGIGQAIVDANRNVLTTGSPE